MPVIVDHHTVGSRQLKLACPRDPQRDLRQPLTAAAPIRWYAEGDACATQRPSLFAPVDPEPYIYSSLDTTPSTISIDTPLLSVSGIDLPGKEDLLDILTNGLNVDLGITTINIPVLSDLVGATDAAQIQPYPPISGSPLSGILWGGIGTTLSPYLQFNDDISGISAAPDGANPDYTTAFDDLLNMPANLTNAFLNGYGNVSLDTVLTDLGIATPPTDVALTADLGRLLSPAGSLIDGIGFSDTIGDCSLVCATFDAPETAVGPLASLFEQDQAIAESIGWDGVGSTARPSVHRIDEPVLAAGREHQFAHPGRVGLTFRRLHHRADDRARSLDLAAADLLRHIGIGGQGLVDRGLDQGVVPHHGQSARGHHLLGFTLTGQHALDDLTGHLRGELSVVHQRRDRGDLGWADR